MLQGSARCPKLIKPLEDPIASPLPSGQPQHISPRTAALLVTVLRQWLDPEQGICLQEDGDFSTLLELAIKTKTVGLLQTGFERAAIDPPSGFATELARLQAEILRINLRALSTIAGIAESFGQNALPYVVIKGPLRAEQVYGRFDVRFGSDVDVYVEPEHYRTSMRLLADALGYSCMVPADDHWWHDFLGESPFVAKDEAGLTIDLHNQLQQPGGPYPANTRRFFEEGVMRPVGRTSARILSPDNALMLTAISFGKALRNGEAWIAYAHELSVALKSMPPSAQVALRTRAYELRIGKLFDEFVRLSRALFDVAPSDRLAGADERLAMSACGIAPLGFLSRTRASWRWSDGFGPVRIGRFCSTLAREARSRRALRTATKFD